MLISSINTAKENAKWKQILLFTLLIDENNNPVNNPKPLQDYMNKWDGQLFIDALKLDKNKTVLEIGTVQVALPS